MTQFLSRRLWPALLVLTLPLAASQCGGSDTPTPAPAAATTYSARFSIAGVGTQANVDKPLISVELTPCSPVDGFKVSTCASSSNTLTAPPNMIGNVSNTVIPITGGDKLSGQTLYLTARFNSARANPPSVNSVVTLELLNNDNQVVESVSLNGADAANPANRYDSSPGNYDVIKYKKVVFP